MTITPQDVKKAFKYFYTKDLTKLPYHKCYASCYEDTDMVLCTVVVSKIMPSGKLCYATYLLDMGCLGLKNTHGRISIEENGFQLDIEQLYQAHEEGYEEITVEYAHNLIYGAIDYAESCGFPPMDKDWKYSQKFLDEDLITDVIDEIPFGYEDGKPYYFEGPYDNARKILAKLRRKFGEDGFHFTQVRNF